MAGKRLFICYARVDAVTVQAVASECAQLGQDVWFDQQLSGGQQWWDTILENIRNCDCFVFALSPSSLHSKACRAELDYAHRLERRILPVVVGEYVPDQLLPPYVAQTQRVDPAQPHQLARALLSLEPAPPFTGPQPPPPAVPISYLDELAGAVEKRELALSEQRNLVGELKDRLAQEDDRDGVRALLVRLRQRSDVYNSVAAEIDEILTALPPPSTRGPVVPPPPLESSARRRKVRVVAGVIAALLVVGGVAVVAFVVANQDDDTADPPSTEAPRPTSAPSPTDGPAPSTRPVVTTNPTPTAARTTDPRADRGADHHDARREVPGRRLLRCEPLTSLAGRPVPLEAAICTFPGSILAEFYNFRPEDLESDVASWTPSALSSTGWNDGDGLSVAACSTSSSPTARRASTGRTTRTVQRPGVRRSGRVRPVRQHRVVLARLRRARVLTGTRSTARPATVTFGWVELPDFHIPHAEKIEWTIETMGRGRAGPVGRRQRPLRAGYTYTIGFPAHVAFPEVVVFGLTPAAGAGVGLVADVRRGGTEIPLDVELVGLLDNELRCRFDPIDLQGGGLSTTAAAWYRGEPFEVVQFVYPDRNGFLPDEPASTTACATRSRCSTRPRSACPASACRSGARPAERRVRRAGASMCPLKCLGAAACRSGGLDR